MSKSPVHLNTSPESASVEALASLERERDRMRRYLEAAQMIFLGLDTAHRITLVNRKGCEVLGYEESCLVGQDWIGHVALEHRALATSEFHQLLRRKPRSPQHCEYAVLNHAGEPRLIVWRSVIVDHPGQESEVLCSGDDVTDSRQAEIAIHVARERVMNVSRLATMGEMASSISNELNQPLAAIANYAQASLRLLISGSPDFTDLTEAQRQIAEQALRAGDIIRRLRNLTSKRETTRQSCDLNEVISEIEPLIGADARASHAHVVMQLADKLPSVRIDRLQIQQVVLNLVRNAIDAVGENTAALRQVLIGTDASQPANVRISVRDSGPGVDDAVRERLFTPFLTTKKSGTGLGLAVSRTIIESHRGRLEYRPILPCGSEFVVTLPADSAAADSASDSDASR